MKEAATRRDTTAAKNAKTLRKKILTQRTQRARRNESSSRDSHPRLQPGVASRPTPSEPGFSPARIITKSRISTLGLKPQRFIRSP